MKIDRARFVLLTATIAATTAASVVVSSGCSSTTTKDTDAGSSNTDSGSNADADSGKNDDGGSQTDASDAAVCLGDTANRTAVCGPTDDAGTDDAGDGGDGGSVKCAAECGYLFDKYKGDVAKSIHACLSIAPTCEEDPANCIGAAIDKACPEPTAEGECLSLLAGCSDAGPALPTPAECVRAITPLNAAGKASFVSCMTEGVDCGSCVYLATKTLF